MNNTYGSGFVRKIQAGVKYIRTYNSIQLNIVLLNNTGAPVTPEQLKEIANDAVLHFYKELYE